MLTPDIKTVKKLASKGNLVALSCRIPADLETPVSCFMKVADKLPHAYLLESAEQAEQIGRYSIIGLNPSDTLILDKDNLFRMQKGKKRLLPIDMTITDFMEAAMKQQRLSNPEAIPGFSGGYVGFYSYENVEDFEKITLKKKKGVSSPKSVFYLTRDFIIFDHYKKSLTFVAIIEIDKASKIKSQYEKAVKKIQGLIRQLNKPLKTPAKRKVDTSKLKSNMTPATFRKKVQKIKAYIRAGDCIQVVLSQRFQMKAPASDFQIYRALRSINPSPYMFYFRCGNTRLIGASPELLVKNTGKRAEVRPIAGTRPRGVTEKEDLRLEDSLNQSKKELAEHLMLVDLGRNDLGRVCDFNSVQVDQFARVERYSHVMHLVSDVSGKLKSGKNRFDLLKATFPAGTVSGAPKIRAMQIIDELETENRGPYAGSVGFFSYNGEMEMAITIRTVVVEGKKLYLQAGAGIVKDSKPKKEYEETVNKAKAMVKAIQEVGGF